MVPVLRGPHWSLRDITRDQWGPLQEQLMERCANSTLMDNAPAVTAALGWRGRCCCGATKVTKNDRASYPRPWRCPERERDRCAAKSALVTLTMVMDLLTLASENTCVCAQLAVNDRATPQSK